MAVFFRRLAVFSFLAVTTLAEAVKLKYGGFISAVMQYDGNLMAVGLFHFSAVTSLAETVKLKYGGIFSTVMAVIVWR